MKRSSCPELLRQILLVSKYITLYLVQSQPPAFFIFVDPLNNYFRVNIGHSIKCSCLPGNTDHCLHTFYVLMKIFKISESNPLIYQQSYTEKQLQYILDSERIKSQVPTKEKYIEPEALRHKVNLNKGKEEKDILFQEKQKKEIKGNQSQLILKQKKAIIQEIMTTIQQKQRGEAKQKEQRRQPEQRIQKRKAIQKQQRGQTCQREQGVDQFSIEKDSLCSICYELLENNNPIMKCPSLCNNFFHIKCLKFWINYKKKQEMTPSCPMCRSVFQQNINERLKKEETRYINHYFSFQTQCFECKEVILSKLFKCLVCKEANLCQKCYVGWKHLNHDRYLMKKSKKAEWSYPSTRNQGSMAKLDLSLKYMKQFKDQHEMKVLFGPNYQKFLEENIKKETILEYIINSLTSVSKQIYKTYKKIDYQEKDIKCILCKKGKITEMRRLGCKHFIDEKCLTYLLINDIRCCPFDKTWLLPAFETLHLKITKK